MQNKDGFTLVEIVATLVLASILTLIAGLFIVQGVKGYVLTKENTQISENARLLLNRVTSELMKASTIISMTADPTADLPINIVYLHSDRPTDSIANRRIIIEKNGNIYINIHNGGESLLIENATMTIRAIKPTSESTLELNNAVLHMILYIDHPDTNIGRVKFRTQVYPRNAS